MGGGSICDQLRGSHFSLREGWAVSTCGTNALCVQLQCSHLSLQEGVQCQRVALTLYALSFNAAISACKTGGQWR
eukprot:4983542-Karenia_brevis.AAC.1